MIAFHCGTVVGVTLLYDPVVEGSTMTAKRAPSRAAWFSMFWMKMYRAYSKMPKKNIKKATATRANSTMAAPWRAALGTRERVIMGGYLLGFRIRESDRRA